MSHPRRDRENWPDDARILAEIGRQLYSQATHITVCIPSELAEQAIAAWKRDGDEGPVTEESPEERSVRKRSAALGLIGLALMERGENENGRLVVELDAWVIGDALTAAEEDGLLADASAGPPANGTRP